MKSDFEDSSVKISIVSSNCVASNFPMVVFQSFTDRLVILSTKQMDIDSVD